MKKAELNGIATLGQVPNQDPYGGHNQMGASSTVTLQQGSDTELVLEFKSRMEQELLAMCKEIEKAGYAIDRVSLEIMVSTEIEDNTDLF